MLRTARVALVTLGSLILVLVPASTAFSAPDKAPSRLSGTADCGSAGTFDFVVNSGNAQGTTWSPAFATGTGGQRAIFLPVSFDLVFTSPFGTDTEIASKSTAPGPVSYSITGSPAGFPEATLIGTVTGTIVSTG